METKYSFKTGLYKGISSFLSLAVAVATFTGFYDANLWDLVTQHLKPLLSSLSVGGLIVVAQNWVKVRYNDPVGRALGVRK